MARKWSKVHDQKVREILERMTAEARPFADSSPAAVASRKNLADDAWLHTYLPHYFSCESAPAHLVADALVEEMGLPIGLKWGREMGKSTRYAIGKPVRWTVERRIRFLIFGSRNEDLGCDKLDMVKLELQHNARLRADYGDGIGPEAGSNGDGDWIANGVRFLAQGIGQSPRGVLHRQWRPDAFIGDDLEDDELARSRDREDALWKWLFTTVWGCLAGAGSQARFILLLNTFGRHSLAAKMKARAEETDARGREVMRLFVFPSVGEDGKVTWPARHQQAALDRAESIVGTRNFRKEYKCIDDDENAKILPEYVKTFSVKNLNRRGMLIRVGADASSTVTDTSDYKAIIVLGRMPVLRDIFCLHAWIRKTTPQEMISHLFWVWDTFHPPWISPEGNGFQAWLKDMVQMREDLDHRAQRMTLHPVVNTENKLDKLLAYEATFQSGYCWFDPDEGDQKLLLEQWYSVGGGKDHDDGPDAYDIADRQFPKILSAATGAGSSRRTRGDLPFREKPERFEEVPANAFAEGQAIWKTDLRSDQSFLSAGARSL